MQKLVIVLHDLRGGGAEKMMVRLANQIANDGDHVTVVLISEGGQNKPFLSDNVDLIELRCHRTLGAFSPLRKALMQLQPDAILAVLTHINVITFFVCLSLGWLSRFHVSERNTFSLDKSVNRNAVMRFAYFLAPFIYRVMPNPVIAVSKGVATDLVQTTSVRSRDTVVAPNPVVTPEVLALAEQTPKHPWLINKTQLTIITAGRLAHQKGFDLLINAFSQVRKSIDCRLIIFGEGELRDALESQISSLQLEHYVSLPGYTDNPIAEMKAADLYVLSSRFEGSPNALVEAMSVGTRVVSFDCPSGARDILENGKIAPLIEYLNTEALAAAITSELSNTTTKPNQHLMAAANKYSSSHAANAYKLLMKLTTSNSVTQDSIGGIN
jgi:glycosyltransferase involved in cell wall biosynthesis